MKLEGIDIPSKINKIQASCHEEGHSFIMLASDDKLMGIIELHTTLRPEAKQVIKDLHQRNISVYIISGDHEQPTKKLAQALGIDHYFANALPEQKAALIAKFQEEGKSVCFVGDGINDSIALKKAHVSISLRGASTVATDSAQVILMDQTITKLDHFFELAQDFDTNQKTGLATTLVPGVLCVGGIFFLHFGILSAMIFYNISAIAGIGNALLPLIKQKMDL
jgi:Cu2+-exporting ATPase